MNKTVATYKPSQVMDILAKLGWIKFYNPAIKGQYYFLPRGVIVFNEIQDLLKKWLINELNALEIRTPILYDFQDPSIQAESSQFSERLFHVDVNEKNAVMRPGGDYGVLSLLSRQKYLHENHLPITLFEVATSFRKNLTRELSGLLRSHTFTLFDCHTFSKNFSSVWQDYFSMILAQAKLAEFFDFPFDFSIDIQKNFYEDYQKEWAELETLLEKPVNIRLLASTGNYWSAQHYFTHSNNQIGFCDGQLDQVNAKNYHITYVNHDGKSQSCPIVCHASFSSIERWIYLLVHESITSKGYDFPVALAPAQVRIMGDHPLTPDVKKVLSQQGLRTEIDFRNKKISDKIKFSKEEWVPFTIVLDHSFISLENEMTVIQLNGLTEKITLQNFCDKTRNIIHKIDSPLTDLQSIIGKPALR